MEKRTFNRNKPFNNNGDRRGGSDRPRSFDRPPSRSGGFGSRSSGSGSSFGSGSGFRPRPEGEFRSRPEGEFRSRERSFSGFKRDGQSSSPYGGERKFGDRKPSMGRESPVISMELINGATLPKYMSSAASGMDIHSNINMNVEPKTLVHITTGLIINSMPPRVVVSLRSRSSLAKDGLLLLSPTILTGENLKAELIITFYNLTDKVIMVNSGDRVAQMVFTLPEKVVMEVSEDLSATERDQGGFGSTGKGTETTETETETEE
jgi:dUTP pyrophosphatase